MAAGAPSHSATTGELDVYQTNCRCVALGMDKLQCENITQHASRHYVRSWQIASPKPMKGSGIAPSNTSSSAREAACD